MAEMPISRAEKLASAKKKLKQYQMKNKESPSESGRSTPSLKHLDGKDENENGESTYSLSENLSSNISRTESPVLGQDPNLCVGSYNGNTQADNVNGAHPPDSLPNVSVNLFQSSSSISPQPDFFDTFSSGETTRTTNSQLDQAFLFQVDSSTPNGQSAPKNNQKNFLEASHVSFPNVSCSPIGESETLPYAQTWNDAAHKAGVVSEENVLDQKNEIEKLKKNLEEMTGSLKHHVNAIDILVSEKSELQSFLELERNSMQSKMAEVEELQGRLRASRHRVGDLERDLRLAREQVTGLEIKFQDLNTQQVSYSSQADLLRKHVGDLELEVSDLKNKLGNHERVISEQQAEINDKTSQLSLTQIRIQQLSGGAEVDRSVETGLRNQVEQLTCDVVNLQTQLSLATTAATDSKREYQLYVDQLLNDVQQLKAANEISSGQCTELQAREQRLVQQVSELERQLNRAPTLEDPALQQLRLQLTQVSETCQALQAQLEHKSSEVECLREGLQERAVRIQELEATVDQLETDRPDTANLQAAIESDKVAASRAVAQNNSLKKQMEQLQDAIVTLSNDKAHLTEQLQQEQHERRELASKLDSVQVTKLVEVKAQQTELPRLQESEVQTAASQPVVSPDMMSKLEEKFLKTMAELAEMSDEKQRLEHLVMQLQGETETIGEYITLYQIQRGMLRQRAQEKDEQVAKLAQDKEALRNKLAELNCLVQRLVGAGHNPATPPLTNGTEVEVNGQEVDKEIVSSSPQGSKTKLETAEKIQNLLTEIGSHNLVTNSSAPESTNINFHPCPWCSGRLINI